MALAKTVHNDPSNLVDESIQGYLLTRPDLELVHPQEQRIVSRRSIEPQKVALVCGGGAGHEPAHIGFVGQGMLTVAVSGGIFSSPTVAAVENAIFHAAGDRRGSASPGVLLVIKNYTGDRLAFGAAAEKARSKGIPVETVYVCDDVALEGGAVIGRRGLAGTVLVYKVAGALAELGAPLPVVARVARAVAQGCITYGASLTVCDIPGRAPSTRLAGEAVELGLGIHGEPGATRLDSVPTTNDLCSTMMGQLVAALADTSPTPTSPPIPCALLVNNYGGLSPLEQGGVVRSVVEWVAAHPTTLTLQRITAGTLVTSLAMRGFSLTLLPLNLELGEGGEAAMPGGGGGGHYPSLEALLDAPGTVAWVPCAAPPPGATCITLGGGGAPVVQQQQCGGGGGVGALEAAFAALPPTSVEGAGAGSREALLLLKALEAATGALLAAEGSLNALDAKVGDGDTGFTFASMAKAALVSAAPQLQRMAAAAAAVAPSTTTTTNTTTLLNSPVLLGTLLPALLADIADSFSGVVGGTSGLLYTLMLRAVGVSLQQQQQSAQGTKLSLALACTTGLAAVGGAANSKEGQRSMLDALGPAARALEGVVVVMGEGGPAAAGVSLDAVAQAAKTGAEATASMAPVAGRSSWVSVEVALGVQDPGAAAAAIWVGAVVEALKGFL